MEKAEQLRELLAKATPGPWQSKDPYLWDEIVGNIDGPDDGQYHYTEVAQAFGRADAALIVAAVNALPGILADYAAMQTRAKQAEAALSVVREEAASVGWKACRRQVFALCEHTQDNVGDTPYENGRRHEAKSIARAMNAFGPESCDVLQAAMIAHGGAGEGEGNA